MGRLRFPALLRSCVGVFSMTCRCIWFCFVGQSYIWQIIFDVIMDVSVESIFNE